ncbi:Na+/H+ antiporter NhaA [Urbifossiella limnaea]|uniref:Na(+)/H(+) antiporter NhaA n=1 Tax=Urbifossiella limnaea TaxID=2528023 RepID=A0A517XTI2_9BACT|nr:Na+/H+ antiporter NhaA [Urbifossiella limnaea]QDU20839.1 Na(+)/H(+) antiporter NhaA [Urbifossiella limnaea]
MQPQTSGSSHIPDTPVRRFTRPLAQFLAVESAGGIVLLVCTAVALAAANSPIGPAYEHFWHTPVWLEVDGFRLGGELGHFVVNDVLMTIFFFVVGLEIKREMAAGELRDPRKAALPVAAALGGMLVPAGIYLALRGGSPAARGWGVPMATDIAFVVGVMALLGRRVPFGLKITLLSLAIADDIGAVVVIAAFYSGGLAWGMLGLAALGFGVTYGLNRAGVRAVPVYVVVGAGIWLAVYKSGVHPTVAGVLLGLLTPASAWVGDKTLTDVLRDALVRAPGDGDERFDALRSVGYVAREGLSPLSRLEHALHPWVGFVIMPLFALVNAGVALRPGAVLDPVALAVVAGLVVGKPVGVVAFAWLAVRAGVAQLPAGVNWLMMGGGGALAGIGFTMSLFVAGLAFDDPAHLTAAKVGILAGSTASAVLGAVVLMIAGRAKA